MISMFDPSSHYVEPVFLQCMPNPLSPIHNFLISNPKSLIPHPQSLIPNIYFLIPNPYSLIPDP